MAETDIHEYQRALQAYEMRRGHKGGRARGFVMPSETARDLERALQYWDQLPGWQPLRGPIQKVAPVVLSTPKPRIFNLEE